jgi:hypothetical protein
VLHTALGEYAEAERQLLVARERATQLRHDLYGAVVDAWLGELYARCGRVLEARRLLDSGLAVLSKFDHPEETLLVRAVSARLHAGEAEREAAKRDLAAAEELAMRTVPQHFAEVAWHMAAAYALLDDEPGAEKWAQTAARAFVDEALRMDADLCEAYARLPCHRDAVDYLAGRGVSLWLPEAAGP